MTLIVKISPLSSRVPQGNANGGYYYSQSLVLSSGDFKLLNIGKFGSSYKRVLEYDPRFGEWKSHSQLKHARLEYGMEIIISMPKGVYLFGGAIKPYKTRLA